jgi:(E)-4-hydroxy-3-methylbut-2-enyl-diphosphate synthase
MIKRKITKQVTVGNVKIGGGAPVSVQSMIKPEAGHGSRRRPPRQLRGGTAHAKEVIGEIQRLQSAGCELIRIAVPDFPAAKRIKQIKQETDIPIIADIHFNYKLAIEAAKNGADKIRINPGNIGGRERVKQVVECLKDYGIPIRVGVNSGSLEADILKKYGRPSAPALAESMCRWVRIIEDFGFDRMVLSMKSSDPLVTIDTYRLVSDKLDYPLHVGVTAASGGMDGIVRSSIGIGALLADGIGDTIRVSLTGDSRDEVKVGREILMSLGLRKGIQIIACPTCDRCEIDVEGLVLEIEERLSSEKWIHRDESLRIAVMGCIVNGPGEAKDADFGIAGSRDTCAIFKKGKVVRKVPQDKIVDALMEEIESR